MMVKTSQCPGSGLDVKVRGNVDQTQAQRQSEINFTGPICLMQDTPNEPDNNGHFTTLTDKTEQGNRTIAKLPVNYHDILPVGSKELFVPACNASLKAAVRAETSNQTEEYVWLDNCKMCTDSEKRGPPSRCPGRHFKLNTC